MQENPADALYWPVGNWSYNARVLRVSWPTGTSFGKAQETELMHVQFAYAAIGNSSDGEASNGQAAMAPAARARIVMDNQTNSGVVVAPVQRSNEAVVRRHRYPTVPFLHPPYRAGRRITALAACMRRPTLTGFFISTRSAVAIFVNRPHYGGREGGNPVARAKEL